MPRTATPKTKQAKAPVKSAPAKKAEQAKKPVQALTAVQDASTSRSVGRRKRAAARVRIGRGKGEITVNGIDFKKYFTHFSLQEAVLSPLKSVGKQNDLDVSVKVNGGGKKGQADAVKHGIARALVVWNEEFRKTIKSLGLLTRDARIKERKKFGLKRARRAPQWSKR